jgi:hypothetical protein
MGDLDGAGRELADHLNLGEDLLKSAAGSKAGIKLPFRRPQRRRFWGITGRRFFVLAFLVHL